MKPFFDRLAENEREFYHKVKLISGISATDLGEKKRNRIELNLTDEETYDFCRFNTKKNISSIMMDKLRGYR